ncbi:MAG: DegV family protein [Dehalococcoidia bacterium]
MKRVTIVTDSAACVPGEEIERYGIVVAPLNLVIQDRVFRDGIDMMASDVYDLQRKSKVLPSTSAPSPGELARVYDKVSEDTNSILHLSISSKLSMAFESAIEASEFAKEKNPELEIRVVDTNTAAGAQCFLVLAAAKVADSGGTLQQAVQAVESLAPKLSLFVIVDTLYFLSKGGRVPKASSWAGSLLSIKPIIELANGEAFPVERVRSKPKAIERMIQLMDKRVAGKQVHVNVMHAGIPEEAQNLKEQVLSRFDCIEVYVTEFSPVMGAHTGPGLLGLAFHGSDKS